MQITKTGFKKLTTGTAMVAVLGFAALGAGQGVAQAKPDNPIPPIPGIPGVPGVPVPDVWLPGDPPGHNPFGPPGQVQKGNPVVPGLTGVPPGHWGDPVAVGLPPTWLPANWELLGIPGPQPLVWSVDAGNWGIWWNGAFIAFET